MTSVFDFEILLDSDFQDTYWWTSDTEITIPMEECTGFSKWSHKVLLRVTEDGIDLGFFTWKTDGEQLKLKLWFKYESPDG